MTATDIDTPDIKGLIRHAVTTAGPAFIGSARFRTIIKSVSAQQRPRRSS